MSLDDLTISISKEEVKDMLKLRLNVDLYYAKEKIRLLEIKYKKKYSDFENWMQSYKENFDAWNDYLQWKAYERVVKDLHQALEDVNNAKNIQLT